MFRSVDGGRGVVQAIFMPVSRLFCDLVLIFLSIDAYFWRLLCIWWPSSGWLARIFDVFIIQNLRLNKYPELADWQ